MNAAKNTANSFVSIAGAGQSIDLILKEQINKQAPFLTKAPEKIVASLKDGKVMNEIPPTLQNIFRIEMQPFIIGWIQHDPQQELKALNIPILLLMVIKIFKFIQKKRSY